MLLACFLILPTISATALSDLNYHVYSGEGEIAMQGNIDIGLIKSESVGYLVVPAGTKVVSLYGSLLSLDNYFGDYENYTIEGYGVNDIDVYTVTGVAYVLNVDFIGYKGEALENNGGVLARGTSITPYINGEWMQQ